MSVTQQKADQLLHQLGMHTPEQIDIDKIARSLNAKIVYKALPGSCARLIGYHDHALIATDPAATRERQRFSIAHELGHWIFDRGQHVVSDRMPRKEVQASEKRADEFASDLLLPEFQLRPRVQSLDVEFASLEGIRQLFCTSLTATAIKLAKCTPVACVVCCYSLKGYLKWQAASPSFPLQVRPYSQLRFGTAAARSTQSRVPSQLVPLGAWYPGAPAEHEIYEESVLSSRYEMILSVLRWPAGQPVPIAAA